MNGSNIDETEIRRRNREAVERSFAAVSAGDVDGQLAWFTDDAVLEFPYADPPASVRGRDAIRARLAPALEIFRFTLTIDRVIDCRDPDRLVLEYTSDGSVTTTGKPYRNSYIAVVGFRDGRICAQREYYNPLAARRATSGDR